MHGPSDLPQYNARTRRPQSAAPHAAEDGTRLYTQRREALMHRTKTIGWEDGGSLATSQRRKFSDGSKTLPRREEIQEERVHRGAGQDMMGMGCGVGDGHGRKVCAVPEEGRGSFGAIYRPGMDSRVCQHVERFVKGTGRSMAEGRHLAHLLQLEFRDLVRRGEEMEAEIACLRRQFQQMDSCRREKDAIDRGSFAGMVLAHSDASAELRSRLQVADQKIEEYEVEKEALIDELNAKESSITELEREVARLLTSARVKHEKENRAWRMWEQRISAKWEAYWSVRCRSRPTSAEAPSATWNSRPETNPRGAKGEAPAAAAARAVRLEESHVSTAQEDNFLVWDEARHRQVCLPEEERLGATTAMSTATATPSTSCRRCCCCCRCSSSCYRKAPLTTSQTHGCCRSATPSEANITPTGTSRRRARHRSGPRESSRVSKISGSRRRGSSALRTPSLEADIWEEDVEDEGEGEEERRSDPASAMRFLPGGRDRPDETNFGTATTRRARGSASDRQPPAASTRHQPITTRGDGGDFELSTNGRLRGVDSEVWEGTCLMSTPPSLTSAMPPVSMAPLLIPDESGEWNSGGGPHDFTEHRIYGGEHSRGMATSRVEALESDRVVNEEEACTPRPQCGSWFGRENGVGGSDHFKDPSALQQRNSRVKSLSQQQQQQRQERAAFERWTGPTSSHPPRTAELQRRQQAKDGRHHEDRNDAHRRISPKNKPRTPATAPVTAATDDTGLRSPSSSRATPDRQQQPGQKCANRSTGGGRERQPGQSTKAPALGRTIPTDGDDGRGSPRAEEGPAFGLISVAPTSGVEERHPRRPRQRQERGQDEEEGKFATAADVAAAAVAAAAAFGANRAKGSSVSSPVSCHWRRQEEDGRQRQQQQQQQQQQHWLDGQHKSRRQQQSHHEKEHEQPLSPLSSLSWEETRVKKSPDSDSCSASGRRADPVACPLSVDTATTDPAASREAYSCSGTASSRSQSQHLRFWTSGSSSPSSPGPREPRQSPRNRQRQQGQIFFSDYGGGCAALAASPSCRSYSGPERAPGGRGVRSSPMPGYDNGNKTDSLSVRSTTRSGFPGPVSAPSFRSDPTAAAAAAAGRASSSFAHGRVPVPAATHAAARESSTSRTSRYSSSSRPSRECHPRRNKDLESHSGGTGSASSAAGMMTETWSTGSSVLAPSDRSGSRSASSSGWASGSSSLKSGLVFGGGGRGDDGDGHADDVGGGGNGLSDQENRGGRYGYDPPIAEPTKEQAGRCPARKRGTPFPAAGAGTLIEAR